MAQILSMSLMRKGITIGEIACKLLEKTNSIKLELFFTISSSFWQHWNKWIYEKDSILPHDWIGFALSLAKQYKVAAITPSWALRITSCWHNPPHDYLKLNVDGALLPSNNKVGFGWLLRDEVGRALSYGRALVEGICEPEVFKILAILRGIQLIAGLGIRNIIIESDCLSMI